MDGNPRIVSETVDLGAYEFVPLTPAELLEQLIAQINASGLQLKQPLLATLNAALASIQRGNCHSAVGQLGAFQNKVRAQVTNLVLAMELIEGAQQVIAALVADGSPKTVGKLHSLKRRPNGKMQVKVDGLAGKVCVIEASTNLVDWEVVGTATVQPDGSFEFEDPDTAKFHCRYYRLVQR